MALLYVLAFAGSPVTSAWADDDKGEGREGGGAAPSGGGAPSSSAGASAGGGSGSAIGEREFRLLPAGKFNFSWPSLLFNKPSEQDLAREAVKKGYAKSLGDVLPTVKRAVKGDVLDVRLAKDGSGAWTYSFIILSADRAYVDVSVDAKRNTILEIRRR